MRLVFVFLAVNFSAAMIGASDFSAQELIFLSRNGCVNTAQMKSRLDEALKSLSLPDGYQVVDLDKLNASDRRTGYGTPTVLYKNHDLFSKREPSQAAEPS
jgi:hypothetical protein